MLTPRSILAASVSLALAASALTALAETVTPRAVAPPAPVSPTPPTAALPSVFAYSPSALAATRQRIAEGDLAILPAFDQLLSEANKALAMKPPSVMDKAKAISGDKHDYYSQAPYWWPDPTKLDGLPYIRKDGQVNPESKDGNDAKIYPRVCNTIELLGLAYYFTHQEAYAQKAAELARVWFLDPATRMNPNLTYAQGIPGRNDGRGAGVLEGRHILAATDGLALITASPAWPTSAQTAMRTWLEAYYKWLTTSKNGQDEMRAVNNHGSWYAVQAASLELALGKTTAARARIEKHLTTFIASQITPTGEQPHELARTNSLSYSLFNLEALFALANLGDRAGFPQGWAYTTKDGRSLHAALAYVAPYIDPTKTWPKIDLTPGKTARLSPLLRAYLAHQPDATLRALYEQFSLTPEARTARWHLLLDPVK